MFDIIVALFWIHTTFQIDLLLHFMFTILHMHAYGYQSIYMFWHFSLYIMYAIYFP